MENKCFFLNNILTAFTILPNRYIFILQINQYRPLLVEEIIQHFVPKISIWILIGVIICLYIQAKFYYLGISALAVFIHFNYTYILFLTFMNLLFLYCFMFINLIFIFLLNKPDYYWVRQQVCILCFHLQIFHSDVIVYLILLT